MSSAAKRRRKQPSREDIRTIACPRCGARPRECCIGADGAPRESNHRERLNLYDGRSEPNRKTREDFGSYREYLQSPEWKTRRKRVVKRQGGKCPCGRSICDVHHKTYKRVYNEPISDLVGLCRPCHARVHELTDQGVDLAEATTVVLAGVAVLEPRKEPKKPRKPRQKRRRSKQLAGRANKSDPDFVPFRPPVGGGLPRKTIRADGTVRSHLDEPPNQPSRRARRKKAA